MLLSQASHNISAFYGVLPELISHPSLEVYVVLDSLKTG